MSRFLRRFKLQPDCAGTIAVVTRVTLRIVRQTRLEKVVKLTSFDEEERARPALAYWLSRPPAERVAAVEYLPFIGRETYLRNKLAAGRPTDLADIDALEAGHE